MASNCPKYGLGMRKKQPHEDLAKEKMFLGHIHAMVETSEEEP